MYSYDDARDAEQEAALEKAKQDGAAIERAMQCQIKQEQLDKLEQELHTEFRGEIEAKEEAECKREEADKAGRQAFRRRIRQEIKETNDLRPLRDQVKEDLAKLDRLYRKSYHPEVLEVICEEIKIAEYMLRLIRVERRRRELERKAQPLLTAESLMVDYIWNTRK
jgi:hypothetical protein